MKSVRLTNDLRKQILKLALNAVLAEYKAKLDLENDVLFVKLWGALLPKDMRFWMSSHPEAFSTCGAIRVFDSFDMLGQVSYDEDRIKPVYGDVVGCIPAKTPSWPVIAKDRVDPETLDRLEKHQHEKVKFDQLERDLKREIEAVLQGVNTTGRLLEVWPDLCTLCPGLGLLLAAPAPTDKKLPAVTNIDTIRELVATAKAKG